MRIFMPVIIFIFLRRSFCTALSFTHPIAAVPDGLKAWEVLKERHRNIDLVLTEVELPSISGYALLTLMMEHDNCKNIPVIMMSSHDSVSTVYNCMLRGAADFLVKPVRRNELRNLWQHVWRRKTSIGSGLRAPDESIAQQKVEATAENNAVSNYSSGYMACIQMNRECIEKGSDAQSSCTKPEVDIEGADTGHVQGLSQKKWKTVRSNDRERSIQERHQVGNRVMLPDDDSQGTQAAASIANDTIHGGDKTSGNCWGHVNVIGQTRENDHVLMNSSREAIDLIGAFDNSLKGTCKSFNFSTGANKNDISPLLDLSLRRSDPSCSVNQVTDERPKLLHSDASAFSRYVNKRSQPHHSTSPSNCNQRTDFEINSSHPFDYKSNLYVPTLSSQKHVFVAAVEPGQAETRHPYSEQKVAPLPIPVQGLRFETLGNTYGSEISPIYCPQVRSFYPSNDQTGAAQQFNDLMDQRISDATDQANNKQENTLETFEGQGHLSSTTDHNTNSSFCNGTSSHFYSIGSGKHMVTSTEVCMESHLVSNRETGVMNAVSGFKATTDCGDDEVILHHDGKSNRSVQRAVALTKFRLKRKERCYEKKVRYENRKKLAEQRPRVKGQFVRQAQNDLAFGSSSAS
ncbi:two-component response regulator-like APRR5 isoform X2 [Olea europaea var. sylvestris]|uniref:two-component response regulator-like APRR5 isoform X2 n=1 Tax=Olea europaea var. sylvestris TaxID=158386 RepID=UPI000C1CF9E9|nr:two-component response regulator-like APRR5 isoform X2 [Olea europaea var. sylvestris]XP_022890420.1 two-component response regulator-like APRR5 isoform X2 [Olea europaea var. sylvestris]